MGVIVIFITIKAYIRGFIDNISKKLKTLKEIKMQYILCLVLIIYALPLLLIVISALSTDFFALERDIIYVASAISAINSGYFRDIFGSIIVPLVTAFSIQISRDQKIPRATLTLFTFFVVLYVLSSIFYGVVVSKEEKLKHFGEAIFNSFRDITGANMKETLIYIAMTIGITVKRG